MNDVFKFIETPYSQRKMSQFRSEDPNDNGIETASYLGLISSIDKWAIRTILACLLFFKEKISRA